MKTPAYQRHLSPSRYAGSLHKLIATHEPLRLVDTLIVGGEQLTTALASGKPPAFATVPTRWLLEFVALDAVEPVDNYVSAATMDNIADGLKVAVVGGKLMGLPDVEAMQEKVVDLIFNEMKDGIADIKDPEKLWQRFMPIGQGLEQLGNRDFIRVQTAGFAGKDHGAIHADPMSVCAGHQRSPRRRADGRGGIERGHRHALGRHPIEVRGRDALRPEAADVGVPDVVDEDDEGAVQLRALVPEVGGDGKRHARRQ